MQVYVAHTFELDDAALAVKEILQGLPAGILEEAQNKHAVGIVSTHADALSAGIMQAFHEIMPFDVVGMSTFGSAGAGEADLALLTFTLFISQEVRFATAMTEVLDLEDAVHGNFQQALEKAYTTIEEKLGEKPCLLITYAPFSPEVTGQSITTYLTKISQGVPLFGALASDETAHCSNSYVMHNAEYAKDRLVLLAMAGPITPHFYIASLVPDSLRNKTSLITAAEENTVYTINDMPVMDYVYGLGFSANAWLEAGTVIPFLVDYKDGSPLVARELFGVSAEKHAIFGGEMPIGAQIYLAMQSSEGILQSAESVVEKICAHSDSACAALVVNCVGRSLILGGNPLAEAHKSIEKLEGRLPYHHIYARGEICPVYLPNGQSQNRFHNFSFVVCVLEKK